MGPRSWAPIPGGATDPLACCGRGRWPSPSCPHAHHVLQRAPPAAQSAPPSSASPRSTLPAACARPPARVSCPGPASASSRSPALRPGGAPHAMLQRGPPRLCVCGKSWTPAGPHTSSARGWAVGGCWGAWRGWCWWSSPLRGPLRKGSVSRCGAAAAQCLAALESVLVLQLLLDRAL